MEGLGVTVRLVETELASESTQHSDATGKQEDRCERRAPGQTEREGTSKAQQPSNRCDGAENEQDSSVQEQVAVRSGTEQSVCGCLTGWIRKFLPTRASEAKYSESATRQQSRRPAECSVREALAECCCRQLPAAPRGVKNQQ